MSALLERLEALRRRALDRARAEADEAVRAVEPILQEVARRRGAFEEALLRLEVPAAGPGAPAALHGQAHALRARRREEALEARRGLEQALARAVRGRERVDAARGALLTARARLDVVEALLAAQRARALRERERRREAALDDLATARRRPGEGA
ncbi:MAG: hypothetical protein QM767_13510 [Anaeromyxobacter sp.]